MDPEDHTEAISPLPVNHLRTRIAAALYTRAMSRLEWHRSWDDLQPEVQQTWLDDADAVIRELKATRGNRDR